MKDRTDERLAEVLADHFGGNRDRLIDALRDPETWSDARDIYEALQDIALCDSTDKLVARLRVEPQMTCRGLGRNGAFGWWKV